MPRISYCPCCGYDFRNKNWQKESNELLRRYNAQNKQMIKRCIQISAEYTSIFPKDIYMFLKGISILSEVNVAEGCKVFLKNRSYHTKGLNYLKYIIINLNENEDKIRERLVKTIGGKQVELKNEYE